MHDLGIVAVYRSNLGIEATTVCASHFMYFHIVQVVNLEYETLQGCTVFHDSIITTFLRYALLRKL